MFYDISLTLKYVRMFYLILKFLQYKISNQCKLNTSGIIIISKHLLYFLIGNEEYLFYISGFHSFPNDYKERALKTWRYSYGKSRQRLIYWIFFIKNKLCFSEGSVTFNCYYFATIFSGFLKFHYIIFIFESGMVLLIINYW